MVTDVTTYEASSRPARVPDPMPEPGRPSADRGVGRRAASAGVPMQPGAGSSLPGPADQLEQLRFLH